MLWAATAWDLMLRFRRDVFDELEGIDASNPDSENLWKNVDVFDYMTEAVDAVARQTKSLTKILTIAFDADQAIVRIPKYVLDIHPGTESLLTGRTRLFDANTNDTPYGVSDDYGQRTMFAPLALEVGGVPSRYIRDYNAGSIRLVPIPQTADTLSFMATTTLAYPFVDGSEPIPFTEPADLKLVLQYMKYMAYLKQDADTLDERRSAFWFASFTKDAADRESEIRRIRRPVSKIRSSF